MKLGVNVGKAKLLETVEANLAKHKEEHAEAMKGWLKKLQEQLARSKDLAQDLLDKSNSGLPDGRWMKELDPGKMIPKDWHDEPISFARHYEDAIEMLKLSTDENIGLSRTLFQQLIQDKWEWSDRHAHSNQKYSQVGRR